MKYLKTFNESHNSFEVKDMTEIGNELKRLDFFKDYMSGIDNDEQYESIFKRIESELGEEEAMLLDRIVGMDRGYTTDYFHYHQNGTTGGDDTGKFLRELDSIIEYLNSLTN